MLFSFKMAVVDLSRARRGEKYFAERSYLNTRCQIKLCLSQLDLKRTKNRLLGNSTLSHQDDSMRDPSSWEKVGQGRVNWSAQKHFKEKGRERRNSTACVKRASPKLYSQKCSMIGRSDNRVRWDAFVKAFNTLKWEQTQALKNTLSFPKT